MLLCLGDLMDANCHITIGENGQPQLFFPDGSVLIYKEDGSFVLAEGCAAGESEAEKWLNSQ